MKKLCFGLLLFFSLFLSISANANVCGHWRYWITLESPIPTEVDKDSLLTIQIINRQGNVLYTFATDEKYELGHIYTSNVAGKFFTDSQYYVILKFIKPSGPTITYKSRPIDLPLECQKPFDADVFSFMRNFTRV